MIAKTMFAEIDGVKAPRPKGQDKPVKRIGNPIVRISQTEPTDRFVLWFISNYKYAFNVFFDTDFAQWMKPPDGDRSKWVLSKYKVTVKSLFDRNLIKYGDKQRLTIKLTTTGHVFRIYHNIYFRFTGAALAMVIGVFTLFPNVFNGKSDIMTGVSDTAAEQPKKMLHPLVQADSSQIQHKLNLDSSLIQTDTSTTTKLK